jgi:hypothetical protein
VASISMLTDPEPKAEANQHEYFDEAWKDLTSIGRSKGHVAGPFAFHD